MFNPPEECTIAFEEGACKGARKLGANHPMYIDGKDVPAALNEERASPIDNQIKNGRFPHANPKEVDSAIAAAQRAFPAWREAGTANESRSCARSRTSSKRARLRDRGGACARGRQEPARSARRGQDCVDFFRVYADDFESRKGYEFELPNDPSTVFTSRTGA